MYLCLVVERHPGSQILKRWCEQGGIYLEGIREAKRVAGAERD